MIIAGLIVPFNSNEEISTDSTMSCENCEITQIAFSANSSAMIMDGDLWMWGDNQLGQLGDGTTVNKDIPTKITGEDSANEDTLNGTVTQVALGEFHSAMIMDGVLYAWGDNRFGQLGDKTFNDSNTPTPITGANSPNPNLTGEIDQIALGLRHSAMIMDGDLYMWGSNSYGQLGDGNSTNENFPRQIAGQGNVFNPSLTGQVSQVALGDFHSGMIMDGDLYMWGNNIKGQLGNEENTTLPNSTPIQITGNGGTSGLNGDVTHLSLGAEHTAMIMDGDLWMWGNNEDGQLGNGNNTTRNSPDQITGDGGDSGLDGNISQISLGDFHSGMIMDGDLYMWGNNVVGQLGDGSFSSKDTPTPITGEDSANPDINGEITQIAFGSFHSGMIMDGNLHMWGNDSLGQLGNGEDGSSTFPELVIDTIDSSSTNDETDNGLNLPLIIGVSVGALVLIVLLGVGGYFVMTRR